MPQAIRKPAGASAFFSARLWLLGAVLGMGALSAHATDGYWRVTTGGNFNQLNRWFGNFLPEADDNAIFNLSNSYTVHWPASYSGTNANAYFNASNGTVTLNISNSFWRLTNSFGVGQSAFSTANVSVVSGTLLVTNPSGTAQFIIGQNGRGTYQLQGGTVVADWLLATNNGAGFTNSILGLSNGSLTTLRGSHIVVASNRNLIVGHVPGQAMNWSMLGGSNHVSTLGFAALHLGETAGSRAQVTVAGVNTIWNLEGPSYVGWEGSGNSITISNGATMNALALLAGGVDSDGTNSVVITGPGSQLNSEQAVRLGSESDGNQLWVRNGAVLSSGLAGVGADNGGTGVGNRNLVVVEGSGSTWTNWGHLGIGERSSSNQVWVTNGGALINRGSFGQSVIIGRLPAGSNQMLVVAGPNSRFVSENAWTHMGQNGSGGQLIVANGGFARMTTTELGQNSNSWHNRLVVSNAGSLWQGTTELCVGNSGSSNQLRVTDGGVVTVSNVTLSAKPGANGNWAQVDGGSLYATGLARRGVIQIGLAGDALFRLEDGLVEVDRLLATNGALSRLQLFGGTLRAWSVQHDNGQTLTLGTGLLRATMELLVGGTNLFARGLRINPGSRLTGEGRIMGSVTNGVAGTLAPGTNFGTLEINGHLELAAGSTNVFQINAAGTRDQVIGLTSVSYGGRLIVTNLGGVLTNGSSFQLFSAAARTGAFQQLVLPPLPPGLAWTNKLLVDGSIAVGPMPPMPYTTLISFGANWKYLDNGSDQGTAWTAPGFSDSGWSNGLAELGYGDGDEATVVGYGGDPNNKYITTYFRHFFTVEDPQNISNLLFRILRDDGVVAHLNGVEVLRDNMPAGPITFTNRAITFAEESPGLVPVVVRIPATGLMPGDNVLAVEIHQSDSVSSDISFDLELTAVPINLLPPVTRVWTGAGSNGLWSNPTNWLGQELPATGDDLVFPAGASRWVNTNDLVPGLVVNTLRFETNGYHLHGTNSVTVLTGLTNAAAAGTNSVSMSLLFVGPSFLSSVSTGGVLQLSALTASEGGVNFQNAGLVAVTTGRGPAAVNKSGPGTLYLQNNPAFTGPTTVSAGSLILSGSAQTPHIEVNNGARLGGFAGVRNVTINDGRFAPGGTFDVPGVTGNLFVSNLVFTPGPGFQAVELDVTGTGSDQIFVQGTADLTGASLELWVHTNLAMGATRTVITRTSTNALITGTLAGLPEGALISTTNGAFRINYTGGTGQDVTLTRVAVTNVWTGGGTNNLWSNAANWETPDVPTTGNHLVFPAAAQRMTHHDLPTNHAYASVTFTAPDYLVSGGPLTLSRLHASQTSGTNRLQTPLILTNIPSVVVEHSAAALLLEGGLQLNASLCPITNVGGLRLAGALSGPAFAVVDKWGGGACEIYSATPWQGTFGVREGVVASLGNFPSVLASLRGGIFYGTGTVQQVSPFAFSLGGRLGAGQSEGQVGLLQVANLLLNSNVTVEVDLLAAGHDRIQAGPATQPRLTNAALNLNLGYNPPALAQFRILDNLSPSPTFGTFAGLPEGALLTNQGVVFSITYNGGDGNDVVLSRINSLMNLTSVTPQPGGGSIALAGQGAPGWNFILEAATNLTPPVVWLPVSTNTADTNGVFQFLQSAQTNDPARFYRARAADNP